MERMGALLRSPYAMPILLLGTVFAVYGNIYGNGWHYDDLHAITENPHIRSLAQPWRFFTDPVQFSRDADKAMYRPLLLTTFALNYAWSQLETYSYHIVNLALQAGCAIMVWLLLTGMGRSRSLAAFGALAFAVHPLATEPVNYISSRSELFMAFWVLAAVVGHQRARGGLANPARVVSVLCFGLGVLSKSVAITTPALLLLHDLARERHWRRLRAAVYAPYAVVGLAYLLMVREHMARAVVTEPVRDMATQLATQAKAGPYYLKLLAFPIGLNVHHQFFEAGLASVLILSGLLLASLLWLLLRHASGGMLLGLGWIGVTLAPTAIVPLNVLVNDHRLYLPLVGAVLTLAALRDVRPRSSAAAIIVVCLLLLGATTWQRNRVWLDEYTLWSDAAAKSPNPLAPIAFIHLGNYAMEHGALGEAVGYFGRALEIAPDHVAARNNLGRVYERQGDLDRAIDAYQDLLVTDPEVSEAWHNLGRARQEKARQLEDAGDLVRAAQERAQSREAYRGVSSESYHHGLALNNAGTTFEADGRLDSAAHYYRRALAVEQTTDHGRANFERLLRELGVRAPRLLESGAAAQVEGMCAQLLAAQPGHREALFFLAASRFVQGRYAESVTPNRRLLTLHPDFEHGYLQLANTYESLGDATAAVATYEQQLRRFPAGELAAEAGRRLTRLRQARGGP